MSFRSHQWLRVYSEAGILFSEPSGEERCRLTLSALSWLERQPWALHTDDRFYPEMVSFIRQLSSVLAQFISGSREPGGTFTFCLESNLDASLSPFLVST